MLEAERLFSLLSRRLSETKAAVNRQEEFCSSTGIRLDEKYSGIEKDIEAIKDVVCKWKLAEMVVGVVAVCRREAVAP